MLRTRVLTALILIPMVGWVVWAGGWWVFGALSLVTLLAGYEFHQLMRRGGYAPQIIFLMAIIGALLVDAQFPSLNILRPGLAWLLILSITWQLLQSQDRMPATNWALTVAGGLYLGTVGAHAILLRALPQGLAWTTLAILLTTGGDTAAYFIGTSFGRHKLSPRLSPRKTWEGFFAGLICCVLVGGLVGHLALRRAGAIGAGHGALLGLVAGIAGVFGDLAISMIKRQVKAKDSSNLIPGHGGVLDRTDSLWFILVTTYYYAVWFAT